MPNLFRRPKDDSKSDDRKALFIQKLIHDTDSQLSLDRLRSNHELFDAITDAALGGGVDDKKYVQEKLIQLLASLPDDSLTREMGTGFLLKTLWENLEHPTVSSLGDPYRYRTADGSKNSIQVPHMGKAGSYYARTVTPKHVPANLPDAEVLFDALLARKGESKEHPSKISSLLFALAGIIIHDVFRTSDNDKDVANASSYLDLSPLYGSNQETQNLIRTFANGKLKPDTFAEVRLLSRPPEFSALLICFSRFHNYVAEQLIQINQDGRFNLPANATDLDTLSYEEALARRDNDLFQTARLVTNGLYINIVLNDYVRTILNLQRVESSWNLDPRVDIEQILGQNNIEKACGNQGEDWLNAHMAKICPDIKVEDLTLDDVRTGNHRLAAETPTDPSLWTFDSLQRNAQGSFNDVDLVRILTEATQEVAASFGPRHVPIALKVIEVLGIQQARSWGVASLNEVRSFFGMIPHNTFMDINSDPDIAASLEALYGNVDNVELYPGVVVEEPKVPMTPGSGLCAGFTITRAILSDAVSLVRGDRFYTVDYTPHRLTNFGYKEASSNRSVAGGGVMFKLLMRTFQMRAIQRSLGHESDFDYNQPRLFVTPKLVTHYNTVLSILRDSTSYVLPWSKTIRQLGHTGHTVNNDGSGAIKQQKFVEHAISGPPHSTREFTRFIEAMTAYQICSNSYKLRDVCEIDVVKQVATLSWTQFAAHLFSIPVRNSHDTKAHFDDRHLYEKMTAIFRFIYLDTDPTRSTSIRNNAVQANAELTKEVKAVCEALKCSSFAQGLLHRDAKTGKDDSMPNHGTRLLQRLFDDGKTVEEVASLVVLLAVDLVVSGSFACHQMLDLFLTEPYYSAHWPRIQELADDPAPWTSETLRVYVLEALRLIPSAGPILRVSDTFPGISDWRYTQAVKKGDVLHLDIAAASRDPIRFPDPDTIKLDRPQESYLPFVDGLHGCLIMEVITAGLVAQLRIFGKLKGLKRSPGTQGTLKRKSKDGLVSFLSEAQDEWIPLPTSMKLRFDSLSSLQQPAPSR